MLPAAAQAHWRSPLYSMQLLVAPAEALRRCWADADALFGRVPDWAAHPIDVRHPFCFYYGHLASFAKLKMLPDAPPVGSPPPPAPPRPPQVTHTQTRHPQ